MKKKKVVRELEQRLPEPHIFYDYDDGSSRITAVQMKVDKETTVTLPVDFDANRYFTLNPDVAEAGVDAAVHYIYEGFSEGRVYK